MSETQVFTDEKEQTGDRGFLASIKKMGEDTKHWRKYNKDSLWINHEPKGRKAARLERKASKIEDYDKKKELEEKSKQQAQKYRYKINKKQTSTLADRKNAMNFLKSNNNAWIKRANKGLNKLADVIIGVCDRYDIRNRKINFSFESLEKEKELYNEFIKEKMFPCFESLKNKTIDKNNLSYEYLFEPIINFLSKYKELKVENVLLGKISGELNHSLEPEYSSLDIYNKNDINNFISNHKDSEDGCDKILYFAKTIYENLFFKLFFKVDIDSIDNYIKNEIERYEQIKESFSSDNLENEQFSADSMLILLTLLKFSNFCKKQSNTLENPILIEKLIKVCLILIRNFSSMSVILSKDVQDKLESLVSEEDKNKYENKLDDILKCLIKKNDNDKKTHDNIDNNPFYNYKEYNSIVASVEMYTTSIINDRTSNGTIDRKNRKNIVEEKDIEYLIKKYKIISKIKELKSNIEKLEENIKELKENIKKLEENKEKLKGNKEKIDELKKDIEKLKKDIEKLEENKEKLEEEDEEEDDEEEEDEEDEDEEDEDEDEEDEDEDDEDEDEDEEEEDEDEDEDEEEEDEKEESAWKPLLKTIESATKDFPANRHKTIKSIFENISKVAKGPGVSHLKKLKSEYSIIEANHYKDMVERSKIKSPPHNPDQQKDKKGRRRMDAAEKNEMIKFLYRLDYVNAVEDLIKSVLLDMTHDSKGLSDDSKTAITLITSLLRENNNSMDERGYEFAYNETEKAIVEIERMADERESSGYDDDDDKTDKYTKLLNSKTSPDKDIFILRLFAMFKYICKKNNDDKNLNLDNNSNYKTIYTGCDADTISEASFTNALAKRNYIKDFFKILNSKYTSKNEYNIGNDNDTEEVWKKFYKYYNNYLAKDNIKIENLVSDKDSVKATIKIIKELKGDVSTSEETILKDFLANKAVFDKGQTHSTCIGLN